MRAGFPMLTILCLTLIAFQSNGDDESKRSKEFQVLNNFIGTWDLNNVFTPSEGETTKRQVVSRRTWSRGGKFIRFEDEQPDGEPEFHMLMTYDPVNKNYPATGMSGTTRFELTGTWNEKTKTMSFTGTNSVGIKSNSTHRFIDKNNVEASGTFTDSTDKVLAKISWNQQRRKAE